MQVSPQVRALIRARTMLSDNTIRTVFGGGGSASSRARVREACTELGLRTPDIDAPLTLADVESARAR